MTSLMSQSLNVVSSAAVSCADFNRLATVWRIRVMLDALFLTASNRQAQQPKRAQRLQQRVGRCALGGSNDIFLGQAAILAGAADFRRVDSEFEDHAANRRRQAAGRLLSAGAAGGGAGVVATGSAVQPLVVPPEWSRKQQRARQLPASMRGNHRADIDGRALFDGISAHHASDR